MIEPLSLLLPALLMAQPEPAQSVEASEAVAEVEVEVEEKDDENRIICKRTAVIGSKFKKRICGTAKEWETMSQRAEDTTKDFQRRGKGNEPIR